MRLTDKVAVVTGSTSGIGRGCAELFAEEGARVVINGFPAELGDQVAAGIRAKGGSAAFCCADVRQSEDLRKLVCFAQETYGRLDILMNNACRGRSASVVEQEEKDWDETFAADESSFVTGHALVVDGGLTARLQDAVAARIEQELTGTQE